MWSPLVTSSCKLATGTVTRVQAPSRSGCCQWSVGPRPLSLRPGIILQPIVSSSYRDSDPARGPSDLATRTSASESASMVGHGSTFRVQVGQVASSSDHCQRNSGPTSTGRAHRDWHSQPEHLPQHLPLAVCPHEHCVALALAGVWLSRNHDVPLCRLGAAAPAPGPEHTASHGASGNRPGSLAACQ